MGDRCYLQLTVRKADYDTHGLEGDFDQVVTEDDENGVITVAESEANYGYVTELEEWANKGIPFYGEHCAGAEYGACCFACDGKEYVIVPCNESNMPVVAVDPVDGSINEPNLQEVHKYMWIVKRAEAMLKGESLPTTPVVEPIDVTVILQSDAYGREEFGPYKSWAETFSAMTRLRLETRVNDGVERIIGFVVSGKGA